MIPQLIRSRHVTSYLACTAMLLALQVACSTDHPDIDLASRLLPFCPNLAITATATAQSAFPGYSATKINDGDRDTTVGGQSSWANADMYGPDGFLPNWVALDFGGPQTFSRIDLYTTSGYELQNYDIQVPSGGTWSTIASVRGNRGTLVTTTFSAVAAAQLRILGLRGPEIQPQYVRVNELEVTNCAVQARWPMVRS